MLVKHKCPRPRLFGRWTSGGHLGIFYVIKLFASWLELVGEYVCQCSQCLTFEPMSTYSVDEQPTCGSSSMAINQDSHGLGLTAESSTGSGRASKY